MQDVAAFYSDLPMEEVAERIRARIAGQQPLVFVSGNFNLLHPGHLRLLSFAADAGGLLVVGVNSDATPGVTMPQHIRLQGEVPTAKWSALRYGLEGQLEDHAKRHKPEEIIAKLRQVEVMTGQGTSMADAIRSIGVTEVTYYRWRSEYGGMKLDQVKRLKELEVENSRLRKAVSDLTLDKLILKEAAKGNF